MIILYVDVLYYKKFSRIFFLTLYYSIQAQAIMLLAGNGSSVNHINQPHPLAQVQARPSTAGGYDRNVSHSTSPCSAVQSPIVVMSHVVSQPGGGSGGVKEVSTVKPISCLAPSSNQQEPSKVFNSAGFSAITIIPSGNDIFVYFYSISVTYLFELQYFFMS